MKNINCILGVALAAGFLSLQAPATIVSLNPSGTAALQNLNPNTLGTWLGGLVQDYNNNNGANRDLPYPVGTEQVRIDYTAGGTVSGPSSALIALGTYNYLVLHWGGNPDGAPKQYLQAYYTGDTSGSVLFGDAQGSAYPRPSGAKGLSGAMFFTPVPEPTTMIASALVLLPLAATMVRVVRRKANA